MDKKDKTNLQKRYLIWLYKITKEAFDRIERKFTQVEVDKVVYARLKDSLKKDLGNPAIKKFLEDFQAYYQNKEKEGLSLKFLNSDPKKTAAEYVFISAKLEAVEFAIKELFGAKELDNIKNSYEAEMTKRILESREER